MNSLLPRRRGPDQSVGVLVHRAGLPARWLAATLHVISMGWVLAGVRSWGQGTMCAIAWRGDGSADHFLLH